LCMLQVDLGTDPARYWMLFGREGSSMPPTARHYKILERLARPRRQLPLAQLLGQGMRIARVADGECSEGIPAFRNIEDRLCGLWIETGHLVGDQALRDGFQSEKH